MENLAVDKHQLQELKFLFSFFETILSDSGSFSAIPAKNTGNPCLIAVKGWVLVPPSAESLPKDAEATVGKMFKRQCVVAVVCATDINASRRFFRLLGSGLLDIGVVNILC
ncbi:unnamed protein product [Amaranthus hypochondriacus]